MKWGSIINAIFLIAANNAIAQNDTVFLDANRNKCAKENASYFRLITKQDYHFAVTDYYLDGKVIAKETFKSLDPDIKDGVFILYDSASNRICDGIYNDGKKQSEWEYYFKHTNIVSTVLYYNDDEINGHATYNYNKGNIKKDGNYLNNKPDGIWRYYSEDGTLLASKYFDNGRYIGEMLFYNKKGNIDRYVDSTMTRNYYNGYEFTYKQLSKQALPPVKIAGYINKSVDRTVFMQPGDEQTFDIVLAIDNKGVITNIIFFDNNDEVYESELRRVLYKMPKWIPAILHNKPVKYYYYFTLRYKDGKFY